MLASAAPLSQLESAREGAREEGDVEAWSASTQTNGSTIQATEKALKERGVCGVRMCVNMSHLDRCVG